MRFLIPFLLIANWANACPPNPDHGSERDRLHEALSEAATADEARELSNALWQIWIDAPDEIAQALLDHGMERMRYGDHLGAREALDRLVAYCPDFAEGWNQRAFSFYLQMDYGAALADLNRALALDPRHLGALTGRALTYVGLGDRDAAIADLRAAVALNPWLNERILLQQLLGTEI